MPRDMSFNRGMKRDNFGNRNFNNRNMGGGGGGGGGRMGNMGGGGMGGGGGGGGGGGMNPWEGGMMPGRGILPTPNNNLSLASPQAQLAIASNLLSNLLRSQQDPAPQVPSLLSLGNNYSGPGPNFNNQQNFNQGRFNDRTARNNLKNQRPQPYNKMGNRARDGIAGRRGPQQSRASQSGNQRQNGNQNQRNDKSSKPIASKQNQTIKKEQQDKTSDKTNEKAEAPVALSEENEETEESKKREWKDEKKELSNDKNEVSVKTEDAAGDKDESGDKSTGKKSAARHAESRYAEVPISNMFCHVCNKHMWDGYSFENHLRGRAHQLMMDKLDESYKLKVELMRHDLRVAEEQRELSLTNSKRRGKKVSVDLNVREYCTMCDLNFYGTLSSHRKSEKHQQLKTFLHPRCFPCAKEFPSRIEYDEHCLTPTHMKNAVQNEEQRKNKKKDKLGKGESEIRSAEDEEKDIGTDLKNDKLDESTSDSDFVTDIPEEPIDAKLKIPSYKHCRANQLSVGKSLVKEVSGYHCDKCRRFMLTEEDMTAHLRSITHYRSFIQEIKTLQAAAESAAKSEQENKETNENAESKENEEPDAKRAKLDDDTNEKDEDENVKEGKNEDEDDKYDPAEANDTDEENAEDENQGQNDNESTGISLNEGEDSILEESKENENEQENDNENENENEQENENENENEEKNESPQKTPQGTPRSSAQANRGSYSARARGNRARRSRR